MKTEQHKRDDPRDARIAALEWTGGRGLHRTGRCRPPFPERIRGTWYECHGRFMVQVGDREAMKWGTPCATLEEASAVLLGIVALYRSRRTPLAAGICLASEEAAALTRRVAEVGQS